MLLDIIMNASNYTIPMVIPILASLAMMIFIALPVHEMAHGYTSVWLGDNTPKYTGRLSLNPTAHLDLFGTLCLLFLGFGWAKPVEVNPYNYKNQKQGMALTALAGPVSNLLMAFISMIIMGAISRVFYSEFLDPQYGFIDMLYHAIDGFAYINISLAVFNLIPFPPLDGSRILGLFLPNRIYYTIMQYERQLQTVLIVFLMLGKGTNFIGTVSDKVFWFMYNGVLKIFSLAG